MLIPKRKSGGALSLTRVQIGSLKLDLANASGNEHRIGPIANRAAEIFAGRLQERLRNTARHSAPVRIESLTAAPLDLQMGTMSDERVASTIASAWLESVALKLRL
jgi:hypothetical protein